ncbi:hypothetical protein K502DRAFT_340180 [Neoconidiobolus thromboides FSU 785]|nr:hypothetical protein K502DRAFT_340180 [Neoconidiobolus thromboides FSU 785]
MGKNKYTKKKNLPNLISPLQTPLEKNDSHDTTENWINPLLDNSRHKLKKRDVNNISNLKEDKTNNDVSKTSSRSNTTPKKKRVTTSFNTKNVLDGLYAGTDDDSGLFGNHKLNSSKGSGKGFGSNSETSILKDIGSSLGIVKVKEEEKEVSLGENQDKPNHINTPRTNNIRSSETPSISRVSNTRSYETRGINELQEKITDKKLQAIKHFHFNVMTPITNNSSISEQVGNISETNDISSEKSLTGTSTPTISLKERLNGKPKDMSYFSTNNISLTVKKIGSKIKIVKKKEAITNINDDTALAVTEKKEYKKRGRPRKRDLASNNVSNLNSPAFSGNDSFQDAYYLQRSINGLSQEVNLNEQGQESSSESQQHPNFINVRPRNDIKNNTTKDDQSVRYTTVDSNSGEFSLESHGNSSQRTNNEILNIKSVSQIEMVKNKRIKKNKKGLNEQNIHNNTNSNDQGLTDQYSSSITEQEQNIDNNNTNNRKMRLSEIKDGKLESARYAIRSKNAKKANLKSKHKGINNGNKSNVIKQEPYDEELNDSNNQIQPALIKIEKQGVLLQNSTQNNEIVIADNSINRDQSQAVESNIINTDNDQDFHTNNEAILEQHSSSRETEEKEDEIYDSIEKEIVIEKEYTLENELKTIKTFVTDDEAMSNELFIENQEFILTQKINYFSGDEAQNEKDNSAGQEEADSEKEEDLVERGDSEKENNLPNQQVHNRVQNKEEQSEENQRVEEEKCQKVENLINQEKSSEDERNSVNQEGSEDEENFINQEKDINLKKKLTYVINSLSCYPTIYCIMENSGRSRGMISIERDVHNGKYKSVKGLIQDIDQLLYETKKNCDKKGAMKKDLFDAIGTNYGAMQVIQEDIEYKDEMEFDKIEAPKEKIKELQKLDYSAKSYFSINIYYMKIGDHNKTFRFQEPTRTQYHGLNQHIFDLIDQSNINSDIQFTNEKAPIIKLYSIKNRSKLEACAKSSNSLTIVEIFYGEKESIYSIVIKPIGNSFNVNNTIMLTLDSPKAWIYGAVLAIYKLKDFNVNKTHTHLANFFTPILLAKIKKNTKRVEDIVHRFCEDRKR